MKYIIEQEELLELLGEGIFKKYPYLKHMAFWLCTKGSIFERQVYVTITEPDSKSVTKKD